MRDLIAKLEAAEHGNRKLDDAIYEAFYGYQRVSGGSTSGGAYGEDFWITGRGPEVMGGGVLMGPSPAFTHSLDAARSLLEAGITFLVGGSGNPHQTPRNGFAKLSRQENYISEYSPQFSIEATGATPEIALCIAALKMRAS